MWLPEGPSSFLNTVSSSSSVKSLEVQKERLSIDCSYTHCDVDAVYYIVAKQSESLQFEFILPTEVAVTANINGQDSMATLSMTYYDISGERGNIEENFGRQLYKAVFYGQLNTGDNFIQIRYQQKLGLFERDYGYFTHSRFVERFTYTLAPLSEWQLAPDFIMDIKLSTLHSRPSRDGWSLFKWRAVSCGLEGGETVRKGEKIVYHNQLSKNFPPELTCNMGDSDLVLGKKF